jgi:RNA polymerase sigma factor (TIGR02999 family)
VRPSDLVRETYLRLNAQNAGWKNREQFFGVAASSMRRIVVDRARARKAAKRGRGRRVTLAADAAAVPPSDVDVIDVDRALQDLAALDGRQARLVELRFFGGLTTEEAAETLGISPATANREWGLAKAWLFLRLKSDHSRAASRSNVPG